MGNIWGGALWYHDHLSDHLPNCSSSNDDQRLEHRATLVFPVMVGSKLHLQILSTAVQLNYTT